MKSKLVRLLLYMIERIESIMYKDESIHVDGLITVESHDNTIIKVNHVHRCGLDYVYTVTMSNNAVINITDYHPIMVIDNDVIQEYRLIQYDNITNIGTTEQLVDIGVRVLCKDGTTTIKSIKRSDYKMMTYDISVDSDNTDLAHTYYSNGILLHNCVSNDTSITVRDSSGVRVISMSELYYEHINNNSLLAKLERWLNSLILSLKRQ